MSRYRLPLAIFATIAGPLGVVAALFYWAWAVSLAEPVDWAGVTSTAAFFAPLGLMAGPIAYLLIGENRG